MLFLDAILMYIREFIATIGILVITGGALQSLYQLYMLITKRRFTTNYIRLQFGNCVVLGLEFMVGADIIGSLAQPDYYNLGMLAILVVIRTILSFFLTKELESLTPQEQQGLT